MENRSAVSAYLPKKWRLLTAAGFATVGIACGIVQPALAEWWKLSLFNRSTRVVKPAPLENGFAATIRRLQAESRRAADQGDYAKAVQFAERAAKISEAAAQVAGPTLETSPQKTAEFLADMRSRRVASTAIAANRPARAPLASTRVDTAPPAHSGVVPAVARAATERPVVTHADISAGATRTSEVPPKPAAAATSSATARQPHGAIANTDRPKSGNSTPSNQPRVEVPQGPQLFGSEQYSSRSKPQSSQTVAGNRQQRPAPAAQPAAGSTNDLLAQSRVAAADGELDRAIELAQQGIDASYSSSLFGPPAATRDTIEANRWKSRLVAQKNVPPAGETPPAEQTEPVAQASDSDFQIPPSPQSSSVTEAQTEQVVESSFTRQEASEASTAQMKTPASTDRPAAEVSAPTATDAIWTEDLTPAPGPPPRSKGARESLRYSRSVISRSGGWVDAEKNVETKSTNESPAPDESRPAEEVDSVPEFSLSQVTTPGFVTGNQAPTNRYSKSSTNTTIRQAVAQVPASDSSNHVVTAQFVAKPGDAPKRSDIQQVSDELSDEPEAKQEWWTPVDSQTAASSPSTARSPSKPLPRDIRDVSPDRGVPLKGVDRPTRRFPVLQVLELQKRLEEESRALSKPTAPQTSDTEAFSPAMTGGMLISQASASDSSKSVEGSAARTGPADREPIKVRESRKFQVDDTFGPRPTVTNPRSPWESRQPATGGSEMTYWKPVNSVGGQSTSQPRRPSSSAVSAGVSSDIRLPSAEQPVLSAPVSQVGFEASEAVADDLELPALSSTLTAPVAPGQLPVIAPPPPEQSEAPWFQEPPSETTSPDSAKVRKSSFAMIDLLAEGTSLRLSTIVPLIGFLGLMMIGSALLAFRFVLRKQRSA